jgi:hypothetical protein
MPARFPFHPPVLHTAAVLSFVLAVPALAGGRLADALSGPDARALSAEAVPSRDDGVAFEAAADYEVVVTATRPDDVAFEVTADYEVVVTATPVPAEEVAFEAEADYEVVVTTTALPS